MQTNEKPNIAKIACALGTEPQGNVQAAGGYFAAMQLAADVQDRLDLRTPEELAAKEHRLNYRLTLLKELNTARFLADQKTIDIIENELNQADYVCGYSRPAKVNKT